MEQQKLQKQLIVMQKMQLSAACPLWPQGAGAEEKKKFIFFHFLFFFFFSHYVSLTSPFFCFLSFCICIFHFIVIIFLMLYF